MPSAREQRPAIIGEWLQTEARYLSLMDYWPGISARQVERTSRAVPDKARSYHPVSYTRVGSRSGPPHGSSLHQPDLGKARSFHPVSCNQAGSHCMFDSHSLVVGRHSLVVGRRILGVGRSWVVGNNIEPWRIRVCPARLRQSSQ
jgi:hypothetical protein